MDDELEAIADLPATVSETVFRFSAKGAAVIRSLGQRPRDSIDAKLASPAGAGRFIQASIWWEFTTHRCAESRFQRLLILRLKSWGDAPGWYESALTAL